MIVVQFSMSFVCLCDISQCLALGAQPVYYITFASVCQEVFQTFLKFFCGSFRFRSPACRQPVYYIILSFACQGVFQTFSKFFSTCFQSVVRSLADSLFIISQPFPFVKSFFKLFSSFFDFLFALPLSLRQPCYYTTSHSPCQYLFLTFFNFFRTFFQHPSSALHIPQNTLPAMPPSVSQPTLTRFSTLHLT